MKDPRHIAITGASGGLGRALAKAYAAEGVLLHLCGRNIEEMDTTARLTREEGAEVEVALFDVTEQGSLEDWLLKADSKKPLDLVIANAGICRRIKDDGLEDPTDMGQMFDVNAKAMLRTALAAASLMIPRQRGQLALVSSQAGRVPLLGNPGYSASKAAVRFYGQSLRHSLADKGIEVTVVCPGFIQTPLLESFKGNLINIWPPEKAALYIVKKLATNPKEIRFPWSLNFLLALSAIMPRSLAICLAKLFVK
jgi:short-subunit dehydrogenase